MSIVAQPGPEPAAESAGGSSSGGSARPPAAGGGSGGFFGWLRRLLLRLLARRLCNLTGFVPTETARTTAVQRAREVRAWLSDGYGEFVQYPPGAPRSEREPRERDTGHRVALEWQLARPELTLLGRACDAVDAFVRSAEPPEAEATADDPLRPTVTLRRLPRLVRLVSRTAYPWRVLVESNRPDEMRALLKGIPQWWGIAVHVQEGRPLERLGCKALGGREGVVGGYITTPSGDFGLTCGHVLGPACVSAYRRFLPSRDRWAPDAALVQMGGCFSAPASRAQVASPGWGRVSELVLDHAVAEFTNHRGKRMAGYVCSASLYASDTEGAIRFPTIHISRERTRYFGVAWPPFKGAFSVSGDSGSWVSTVMDGEKRWLGMIVSGSKKGSAAHDASALLRWLELELSGAMPQPEDETWFKHGPMQPFLAEANL
ncbi:hypothetical protein [Actinocrinis sp.]|uniref:hypothetical protein n=1 Tax=Actinocrinis sp. TaxID=1920516 RepID=UPI002D668E1E|nr:hypothetical protein [Actinocrinis sp.]HZP50516.1 hypothetical protein [Actinocrinis sp.]